MPLHLLSLPNEILRLICLETENLLTEREAAAAAGPGPGPIFSDREDANPVSIGPHPYTLKSVSAACRALRGAARPVLFAKTRCYPGQYSAFACMLLDQPDLASAIKSVHWPSGGMAGFSRAQRQRGDDDPSDRRDYDRVLPLILELFYSIPENNNSNPGSSSSKSWLSTAQIWLHLSLLPNLEDALLSVPLAGHVMYTRRDLTFPSLKRIGRPFELGTPYNLRRPSTDILTLGSTAHRAPLLEEIHATASLFAGDVNPPGLRLPSVTTLSLVGFAALDGLRLELVLSTAPGLRKLGLWQARRPEFVSRVTPRQVCAAILAGAPGLEELELGLVGDADSGRLDRGGEPTPAAELRMRFSGLVRLRKLKFLGGTNVYGRGRAVAQAHGGLGGQHGGGEGSLAGTGTVSDLDQRHYYQVDWKDWLPASIEELHIEAHPGFGLVRLAELAPRFFPALKRVTVKKVAMQRGRWPLVEEDGDDGLLDGAQGALDKAGVKLRVIPAAAR
ncbi:hypothetical protein N3K66_004165 [Trichothecium roseum]|uniref:Uncharacterized protein n=1 Tax=Trichothecium roseum TaxID=47278 RepID=A0ACC0V0H1_9HYPO|nr:hypothetical protein N3K66_004165 [Trichothecium roseum]